MRQVCGTSRALTFFAVQGRQKDEGYQFESSKDFFLVESHGDKAENLATIHPTLNEVPVDERETLETAFSPQARRDWSLEKGTQVFTMHLQDMMRPTGIAAIEDEPTVWQVNWVEVAWPPPTQQITTKNGDRIFFQTSVRDIIGVETEIWMNETSALALARTQDKMAFVKAWEEGDQLFPIMATVKILRSTKAMTSDSQADTQDVSQSTASRQAYINYLIVDASDQPLHEPPTTAILPLIELLKGPTHGTASIIPAALKQIATSPTYAFEITYETMDKGKPIIVPCQKVIALIRSHTKSTVESLGDGYKLTTPDVQCLLHSGDEHPTGYTVSSVCTLGNLVAYRLDPPRGGSQCALVTITNKIADAYVVESIQLLSEEEAKAARASMHKLMDLVAHFGLRDTKRSVTWTEESSPVTQRKCSRLGRSPTDAPLPTALELKFNADDSATSNRE